MLDIVKKLAGGKVIAISEDVFPFTPEVPL
jgi:hypothetical protein